MPLRSRPGDYTQPSALETTRSRPEHSLSRNQNTGAERRVSLYPASLAPASMRNVASWRVPCDLLHRWRGQRKGANDCQNTGTEQRSTMFLYFDKNSPQTTTFSNFSKAGRTFQYVLRVFASVCYSRNGNRVAQFPVNVNPRNGVSAKFTQNSVFTTPRRV